MIIEFDDPSLRELYLNGSTKDHKYKKLSKEIIKQYVKTVNYIKSLHYEKKKGDLKGSEAVWINHQYRLLFSSSSNENGMVTIVLLEEISKHYEK